MFSNACNFNSNLVLVNSNNPADHNSNENPEVKYLSGQTDSAIIHLALSYS